MKKEVFTEKAPQKHSLWSVELQIETRNPTQEPKQAMSEVCIYGCLFFNKNDLCENRA